MINLLPPFEKITLQEEKNARLAAILGIVAVACLFSLAAILISINVYLQAQAQSQAIISEEASQQFRGSELRGLEQEITALNRSFTNLKEFYERKPYLIADILERVNKVVPKGVSLDEISFSVSQPAEQEKSATTTAQIFLSGLAVKRSLIFDFKRDLEAQPFFNEVYFPPEDWVKPENARFSVKLKMIY